MSGLGRQGGFMEALVQELLPKMLLVDAFRLLDPARSLILSVHTPLADSNLKHQLADTYVTQLNW